MKQFQLNHNPGYFVFHGKIPRKGNKEQVKAQLRLRFNHHMDRFFDSIKFEEDK